MALLPSYGAAKYALYGELSLAPARSLVPIPEGASFEEAAATWTAFGTAWAGLVAIGQLKAGQTVLIPAASSSVGLAALQIARAVGASPIALTRTFAKAAELAEHEATSVIATSEQDVVAEVKRLTGGKGADLVFDPVAGSMFEHLAKATVSGGTLVIYGAMSKEPTIVPPFDVLARDLRIRGLALPAVTGDDAQLVKMKTFIADGLADGSLHTTIARIFPFERIADAHRFMEAGEQVGKIVVTL